MSEQYEDQAFVEEDFSRPHSLKKRNKYPTEFGSAEGYCRRDYHRASQREENDRENEQHWWEEIASTLGSSSDQGQGDDISSSLGTAAQTTTADSTTLGRASTSVDVPGALR